MTNYLSYRKCLDKFVESEHPRDDDGKFSYKEVSKEEHQKGWEKIKSVAAYLNEQGIKTKNISATKYGSLYIKAYLPMKKGYGWADISFRNHDSDSKFDLLLPADATKEDFIIEFEKIRKVFAENDKIHQIQQMLRKKQYKNKEIKTNGKPTP